MKTREFNPKFKVDNEGKFIRDDKGNPIPALRPDGTPIGDWRDVEVTEINREVRLGAIYALERIAQDSERDHWPIMETLTSYVRNNAGAPSGPDDFKDPVATGRWRPEAGNPSAWVSRINKPRPDVQAAIRVLGHQARDRIDAERETGRVFDLHEASYQRADFFGDFSSAKFDDCHLEGATFEGADIAGASFIGASLTCCIPRVSTRSQLLSLVQIWRHRHLCAATLRPRISAMRG